jgi:serine-type D-Ala-D-Ala carboxypeptidase/endopeptidase
VPIDTVSIDTGVIDQIAARFYDRGGQPGVAYGIVAGGKLVHSGGLGERWLGGPPPDADTVFRIASMTKSFTATTVLALRDRGALRLDDPARNYVPELRRLTLAAPDSPAVTLRHLLTMTAGFPTDDPWGDRQQGLDPAEFARLLSSGGVRPAWAPGTRFEYSNLGYALLGRVIEAAAGAEYAATVRSQILVPLGLRQTGYEVAEFASEQLARGYRRDGDSWLELEPDPYGAFAPMGGVFSSVRDLAGWVAGFADAFPPRAAATGDLAHPLSRATRREMQLGRVAIPVGGDGVAVRFTGPLSLSYGYGLFIEDDAEFGTNVQHSGGYPGFGSQMRWHPATGLGAIVLANGTYAWAGALAGQLLASILGTENEQATKRAGYRLRGPVPQPGGPWPETIAARESVDRLLQEWDDAAASVLFTPNVDQDQPFADRRAGIARLRERIGSFRPDPDRLAECESPAHCRWWLTGEHGTAAVSIKLAPLRQPLVQQLLVAVPPAAGSTLAGALDALLGVISASAADGWAGWPEQLKPADGLDADQVLRRLRVAGAWAGPSRIDCYLAGDGETSATVRLVGAAGDVILAVEVGAAHGELRRAEVSLS